MKAWTLVGGSIMDIGIPQRHDIRADGMIAMACIVESSRIISIRVRICATAKRYRGLCINPTVGERSAPPEKKKLTRPQRKHQELAPKVRPAASRVRDWFDPRSRRRKGVPCLRRGA